MTTSLANRKFPTRYTGSGAKRRKTSRPNQSECAVRVVTDALQPELESRFVGGFRSIVSIGVPQDLFAVARLAKEGVKLTMPTSYGVYKRQECHVRKAVSWTFIEAHCRDRANKAGTERLANRPGSYISAYAPSRAEYDVVQPELLASLPRVFGPFRPSTSLVRTFLKSSRAIVADFRQQMSLIPGWTFQSTDLPEQDLLDKVGEMIIDSVHGTMETLAFRAAAAQEKLIYVSTSDGKFRPVASGLLAKCFPLAPYDTPFLLDELHAELLQYAKLNPVLAKWGSLHAGPAGVYVRVLASFPHRGPRAARSVVVGGLQFD